MVAGIATTAVETGTMAAEDRGVLVVREDQEDPVVLGAQAGQEVLVDQVAREVLGQGVIALIPEVLLSFLPVCGSVYACDL